MAAFKGMHVSLAKQNSGSIPRNACVACETAMGVWQMDRQTDGRTDRRTDGQTDRRRTKWSLCFAGDTKTMRDYQESVTTGQTDTWTDKLQTKWSQCVPMLRRPHKNLTKHAVISDYRTITFVIFKNIVDEGECGIPELPLHTAQL